MTYNSTLECEDTAISNDGVLRVTTAAAGNTYSWGGSVALAATPTPTPHPSKGG